MTFTAIPAGTEPWGDPLNNGILDVQSQAVAAQSTANTANTTANTALSNAATAQSSANSAQTTANAAVPKDAQQVSVKDHGAVGNGSTDDTAAIQAAINLLSSGGVVYFPPGSYLLNDTTALLINSAGVVLAGAGAENTKILIGASFTDTAAIKITAYNCQVRDLSVSGANSTTTSNPIANGIEITGARRAKINRCYFANINGWAIEAASTNSSGTSNPFGTMISQCYGNANAGGIHFLGNTTQGFAMNSQVSDCQFYNTGVTSGASANLDSLMVEDAWDVLISNNIMWTAIGTGASLHVKGSCAAGFVQNLDSLGPSTGNCVLMEDSANGSPQNWQINGGVIQQGLIGLNVTGGAFNIHFNTVRLINNQTHGVQIAGTGSPIHLNDVFIQTSGQGATGTNYDLNWSGSSTGYVNGCRFSSNIVAVNSAGVQQSVNIAAAQNVKFLNVQFAGTGALSSNYFTNTPASVLETTAGAFNFRTQILSIGSNMGFQPTSLANTVISSNLNGSQASNNFVVLGDGTIQFGPGGAGPRDAFWSRIGIAQVGTSNADVLINLAGKTLFVKSGTNAKAGTVTANGTTAVNVSTTAATANSTIILSYKSGTQAATQSAWISGLTAGTGFAIKSITGDTAVYNWVILEVN